MDSSEVEKNHISLVDFPFICRICFVRSELRLFEEEKCLWDLFQSLMKIEVHPTNDFPRNVCSDCISKLRDISLFIETSRNTNSYLVNNVFSVNVEDGSLPKHEPTSEDYDHETPKYCRSCLSTTHLSPFEEKISLRQLFQEISGIDVTTSTDTKSICFRCINELEKASSFLILLKRNNVILETLASVDVKEEVLNADDERIIGTSEMKVEINDEQAGNEKNNVADCIYESFMKTEEFQHLHTTIDIKEEVLDNESIILSGSVDEKQFGCFSCDKKFSYKCSLKTHLLTHTGVKPFKCDYCDKRFTQKCNLRTHILTHTREKPFGCDNCNKRFATKGSLQIHLLTYTGEKPFKCDHCEKLFTQGHSLRRHSIIHTREKVFKCDYCDQMYSTKRQWQSHMLTHKENSFKCDYCDKRFTLKGNLRTHILTHTGEKPFECDHCDKRFTQGHSLRRHSTIHTGEEAFKCYHCDKRFSQKKLLRSHLLTHTERHR